MNTKITKNSLERRTTPVRADFFERVWEESWTNIKTVVDVVREPILILDKDFRVIVANQPFYQTFQVEPIDTVSKVVYELGNGQWNISELRNLLENTLPKDTFFKGFEVTHDFPSIGRKVMILNAREVRFREDRSSGLFPPFIMLAMEDITEMMEVADMLARHTNQFEIKLNEQKEKMATRIIELEREVAVLKSK